MAALMLQGQTYGHDILELNPPLILYLHFLPIIVAKITGIKIIYCMPAYFICLIVLSIACARLLFEKLFKQHVMLIYLLSYALACILLFPRPDAFGQREHLLIILTTPYLLLAACRLENIPIKTYFAVLLGVMAGIGFSIKPFFLPTLLLIELLFVYRKKNIFGWVRIEAVIASLIILFYGLTVIFFYPAYLHIVLPFLLPYITGVVKPWGDILCEMYFIFCCATLVLACFTKKSDKHSAIKQVFSLALMGYLIAFLIPRVTWYYHILPALSITCLYFVLILAELADSAIKSSTRVVDWAMIGALAILVFIKPLIDNVTFTTESIAYFHTDSEMSQLTTFLNQYQPNNAYIYFSMTHQLCGLEFYSTASYLGNLSLFWWEYMRLAPEHYSAAYQQKLLSYAMNILSHDLDNQKTQFVIVDMSSSTYYLKQRIDYVKEYARNKQFAAAWSHYTYAATIGTYDIYRRIPG